jgi:GNAT superfamily N-acetyltransferase
MRLLRAVEQGVIPELPRLTETAPGDGLFAAWCAVWAASQRVERPDDPPRPARDHVALADQLLASGGSRDGTHRAALLGNTVVGALRLLFPLRDNPTVALVDVTVHPDHRRSGVGGVLLAEGVRLAGERGRTELIAEVDEPAEGAPGRAFALRHGWTCDLLEGRRDLVLPPDAAALSALEADALAASAGYDVVTWRDRTPDDLLDDRALLERRMTTDAPHGDLPVDEEEWDGARIREYEAAHVARGRTVFSAGAVTGGRLVAFTDLQVPLAQPQRAHQGGTLVLSEHRGHRLGARVKVAVLREVLAVPEVRRISTYNSDANRPMVDVNETLGFRRAGYLSTWARRL